MKILTSLRTRFLVMVSMLFVLLIGSILLLIEKREVEAIFDEQIEKGVLIAKYIKQLNIDAFVLGDERSLSENIEKQIDYQLIYIIFYDRQDRYFASTRFIKGFEDICRSNDLPPNVTPQSYLTKKRKLLDKTTLQVLNILEVEVPIFYEGSAFRWGSIKIGLSLEDTLKEIRKTQSGLMLIGLAGLAMGLIGAVILARRITGPLHKLVDGTVKISKGDFSQTIDIHSSDEIGELAKSFNQMSLQLKISRKHIEEAHQKLIQAEKLASIGRMSAGIAHEIRNPLTSIKLNIQKVFADKQLGDLEKSHLAISQEGIRQIENFIKELLNFTRERKLNFARFPMSVILDESIKMITDSLDLKKIKVTRHYGKNLPSVRVDADKLRQVFVNLLHNAVDAVDEGGLIQVRISCRSRKMRVEISDSGCGIPEKDWDIVFEPYYTTKSSGFGLGLANARKIVELHKGTIRIRSKPEKGTKFEVIIPCEEGP